jgi:uroporphyrinogen decarboxylase
MRVKIMNIREDILTPRERAKAISEGKPADRILCLPMVAISAAYLIGKTIKEFQTDPEVMAESHIAAYKRFKYDSVGLSTNCSVLAEAMGAKLDYPEDDAANSIEPLVNCREDLSKVKDIDPEKDGKLWVLYKAFEIVNKEIGHEVPISISVSGPFTTAATLRGVEAFARDMYADPELCHTLLRKATDNLKRHIKAIVAHGADIGAIADPLASGSVISPKMFKQFAFPYIKELVDFIHGFNRGAALHICGKTEKLLELMVETGADTISIDKVDLKLVKETIAGRATIVGNVDTTNEMLHGPVEKIHEVCREYIDLMKDYNGLYILATSCDVPPKAPFEYVQAMMDVARSYGLYEYKNNI